MWVLRKGKSTRKAKPTRKEALLERKIAYHEGEVKKQQKLLADGQDEHRKLSDAYEWVLENLENTSVAVKKAFETIVSEVSRQQLQRLDSSRGMLELEINRLMRGIVSDKATAEEHRLALLRLKRRRSRRS